MALQNIGASNRDDAFYRYKMPRMITKIEGRGNGIKTNVVNMVEIAKALARPASYTTKYFGCELGAQSKFDEKTGTSHVNGAHDTAKLAGLLENFIKKYVQCYGCGNPETEIIITKTQMLNLKCAACGFVSDVDMRDKLTTFILKNPPEQKKSAKEKKAMRRADKEQLKEGEAADEEQKRLKKEAARKKGTSGSKVSSKKKATGSDEDHSPTRSHIVVSVQAADDDDDDDDVQWHTDTSIEAAKKRIEEQLSAVTADMVMLSNAEEKKKSPPKSPEREKKAEVKTENGADNVHVKLVDEIKQSLKAGSNSSQLKTLLGTLSGTPQEKMDALLEALFEGFGKGFSEEVNKKIKYISEATIAEGSQLTLLRGLESFCGKANPDATKEVAFVLKSLYDEDVLEEEYIVKWYQQGISGKAKSSPIWKNVKPFIEWLQSAESETEDE